MVLAARNRTSTTNSLDLLLGIERMGEQTDEVAGLFSNNECNQLNCFLVMVSLYALTYGDIMWFSLAILIMELHKRQTQKNRKSNYAQQGGEYGGPEIAGSLTSEGGRLIRCVRRSENKDNICDNCENSG